MKYVFLSLLVLLNVCEKDDDQISCINNPISADFVCIEIYDPVCGCDDVTYSNACHATVGGVSTWTDGECPD